jgi:hypothetical protein
MSSRPLVVLAVTIGACLLAGPSLAAATSYTIRVPLPSTDRGGVSQLGPWTLNDPSLARATQVFGSPSFTTAVLPGFANNPNVADCALTWGATRTQGGVHHARYRAGDLQPDEGVGRSHNHESSLADMARTPRRRPHEPDSGSRASCAASSRRLVARNRLQRCRNGPWEDSHRDSDRACRANLRVPDQRRRARRVASSACRMARVAGVGTDRPPC